MTTLIALFALTTTASATEPTDWNDALQAPPAEQAMPSSGTNSAATTSAALTAAAPTSTVTTATVTPPNVAPPEPDSIEVDYRHGFRMGYTFAQSAEEILESPHVALMGYETTQTLKSGGPVSVMFLENILIAGLNHSRIVPTGNVMAGVSIKDTFQIGAGMNLGVGVSEYGNLTPTANMVAGMGLTIATDDTFEIPVNLSWTSDDTNLGRIGLTTGVNWVNRAASRRGAY